MASSDSSDDEDIFGLDFKAAAPAAPAPAGASEAKEDEEVVHEEEPPPPQQRMKRTVLAFGAMKPKEPDPEATPIAPAALDALFRAGVRADWLFWCGGSGFKRPWPCRKVLPGELMGYSDITAKLEADPDLIPVRYFFDSSDDWFHSAREASLSKYYYDPDTPLKQTAKIKCYEADSDRTKWHPRGIQQGLKIAKSKQLKHSFVMAVQLAQQTLEGLQERAADAEAKAIADAERTEDDVVMGLPPSPVKPSRPAQKIASREGIPQSSPDAPERETLRVGDEIFFWKGVFAVGDARGRCQETVVKLYKAGDGTGALRCQTDGEICLEDKVMLRVTTLNETGDRVGVKAKWRELQHFDVELGELKNYETQMAKAAKLAMRDLAEAAKDDPSMGDFLQDQWKAKGTREVTAASDDDNDANSDDDAAAAARKSCSSTGNDANKENKRVDAKGSEGQPAPGLASGPVADAASAPAPVPASRPAVDRSISADRVADRGSDVASDLASMHVSKSAAKKRSADETSPGSPAAPTRHQPRSTKASFFAPESNKTKKAKKAKKAGTSTMEPEAAVAGAAAAEATVAEAALPVAVAEAAAPKAAVSLRSALDQQTRPSSTTAPSKATTAPTAIAPLFMTKTTVTKLDAATPSLMVSRKKARKPANPTKTKASTSTRPPPSPSTAASASPPFSLLPTSPADRASPASPASPVSAVSPGDDAARLPRSRAKPQAQPRLRTSPLAVSPTLQRLERERSAREARDSKARFKASTHQGDALARLPRPSQMRSSPPGQSIGMAKRFREEQNSEAAAHRKKIKATKVQPFANWAVAQQPPN